MVTVRTLLSLALAATATTVCRAETLINTDFSQNTTGWVLNGTAAKQDVDGKQGLALLTGETDQAAAVWTDLKRQVPSFSFIADVRVRFTAPDPASSDVAQRCPADGFTLAYANANADALGGAGGNIGLFGAPDVLPTFVALEVNTWYNAGLGRGFSCEATALKSETAAFDVMKANCDTCFSDPTLGYNDVDRAYGRINAPNAYGDPARGGQRLGQAGFPEGVKIVNGGTYRYHWNVDGATNTMTLYMTGLDDNNKQFQKVKVTEIKSGVPLLDFEGRWGFTGGTGGAVQSAEVFTARIESPMIEP
jgi:hypothetical protein